MGVLIAAAAATSALAAPGTRSVSTLETVRARGTLVCGVGDNIPGFSTVDAAGRWSGLDADFCRAVAAAVLGRADAVTFRPLAEQSRFEALGKGEVDVLARATGITLGRDTELGVRFVGVLFHNGQGFLLRRIQEVTSVLELSGASVCVLAGTRAEDGVTDFFRQRQMRVNIVAADTWGALVKAYLGGRCTLMSDELTMLALERSRLPAPQEHMLLPDVIAKEPLGPAVRQGDEQWFSIVRWVLMALVAAEELGISSESVDGLKTSPAIDVRRFLGLEGNLGHGLGLTAEWSYRIVKGVGNYGELFDRNLGAGSALGLDRGPNRLWTKGGQMYAWPIR